MVIWLFIYLFFKCSIPRSNVVFAYCLNCIQCHTKLFAVVTPSKRVRFCFDIIFPRLCFLFDPASVLVTVIWGSGSNVYVVVLHGVVVWCAEFISLSNKHWGDRLCLFMPIWLVLFISIVLFHTIWSLLRSHMERVIKTYQWEEDDIVIMWRADLL